ncbi:MAG: glycosyltransferase family 4 protein [Phycisphaeraceae bacterium]
MHVALLANTAWLDEELATLHHVVVGLIDESTRVVQVLPRGRAEGETVSFGTRLSWREGKRRWLNRRSLRRLAEPLREQGVGLIHALDGRLWLGALDLATLLNLPAVLSANSGMDVALATRLSDRIGKRPCAITCATAPLAELMRQAVGGAAPVEHVPPGVHLGKVSGRRDEETPCIVVSGNGGADEHVAALLDSARLAIAEHPNLQLFFDGQRQDPHKLWRAISRRGLLANATLIPRRLGHREVLLRAGALLHPQPLGRARSLTLRAMAHAVPVIACADPLLDYLIDGTTARVIHEPTPDNWAQAITGFASKPGAWRELGQSAKQWVGEHRLASTQLESFLSVYRGLIGEPIAFPGPSGNAL